MGAARVERLGLSSDAEVLEALRAEAEAGQLYGVFDAARDPAVLPMLRGGGEEMQSLYNGRRGENLAAVAPYLVRFSPGSELLGALAARAWGRGWGVFLTSGLGFKEVRRHLRTLLVVETRDGQPLYFRFYDPRALRPFLASCNVEEGARLFGPVRSFLMEDRAPLALVRARSPEEIPEEISRGPLRVRSSQLKAFSRELVELFIDGMAARARQGFAGDIARWGAGDEGRLREWIREGMRRAERYGLVEEREVARFLEVMFRLGPDFDAATTWEGRTLRRRDLDGAARLRRIERRVARGAGYSSSSQDRISSASSTG